MGVEKLISAGAIFYCSTSGGKDSQAMYIYLRNNIPANQIVVVHADLGEVEWNGVQDHIRATIAHPLNVVRAGKTLLEMVERRYESRPEVPCWPSSAHRQCTSDLKRGPIQKFIRHDMKAKGATLAVNCMGLRAEESSARAKKLAWSDNKALSKAGRTVYDWLPIHDWPLDRVWSVIAEAGQEPHPAYAGNSRLSCVFCIMGSDSDLRHGAFKNPELLKKYIEIEDRTGWNFRHNRSLREITRSATT